MKIRDIIATLEDFAPLALQDGFDNAGLQIGLPDDADATGVLLSLDVTESVLDEAISHGCNMVVSHHPLLFHPVKSISGKDYVERCIIKAIQNGITLYAAHTNLDNAPQGVNHRIAAMLQLGNIQWLAPKEGVDAGAGLVGNLPQPMPKAEFMEKVKTTFHVDCVRYNDWIGQTVSRVAVCGGAGAFLLPNAVAAGADAFITGEIGYHRFFGHEEELLMLEIGHFESEQYTLDILSEIIQQAASHSDSTTSLPVIKTRLHTNPISYR